MVDTYFADTSALCKRYVLESGSAWLRAIVDPSTGCQVIIVRSTPVEMIAAITRRERGGSLSLADAHKARTDFRSDLASDYHVIELSESLAQRAMDMSEKHGIRGFDAIQLAAASEVNALRTAGGLPAITLLSSDLELNASAAAEGLIVDDPNAHP